MAKFLSVWQTPPLVPFTPGLLAGSGDGGGDGLVAGLGLILDLGGGGPGCLVAGFGDGLGGAGSLPFTPLATWVDSGRGGGGESK